MTLFCYFSYGSKKIQFFNTVFTLKRIELKAMCKKKRKKQYLAPRPFINGTKTNQMWMTKTLRFFLLEPIDAGWFYPPPPLTLNIQN